MLLRVVTLCVLDHPTTVPDHASAVTAIVLVGPPASGKSTIRKMFSDHGVIGCDLDGFHDAGSIATDEWAYVVLDLIDDARKTETQLCCIEGPIEETQVDFIRKHTASVLVINVDASDRGDYVERYVERELSKLTSNENGMISESDIASLETGVSRRHQVEKPYPTHDVSITNSDELSTNELARRCGRIVSAVSESTQESVTPATKSD